MTGRPDPPLLLFGTPERTAEFSPCRTWRYTLTRRWADGPAMLVIGLNPSTADETVNDQTIRKCIGYARREKCGALTMANLFAYRARHPRVMKQAAEPVGPANDAWLARLTLEHDLRVAAWGGHGDHQGRAGDILARGLLGTLQCFGTTNGGHPLHPLYLPGDTPLREYPRP